MNVKVFNSTNVQEHVAISGPEPSCRPCSIPDTLILKLKRPGGVVVIYVVHEAVIHKGRPELFCQVFEPLNPNMSVVVNDGATTQLPTVSQTLLNKPKFADIVYVAYLPT